MYSHQYCRKIPSYHGKESEKSTLLLTLNNQEKNDNYLQNLDNRASKHMFDYKDRIVELQDKIKANVSFSTLFDFAHKLMKVV